MNACKPSRLNMEHYSARQRPPVFTRGEARATTKRDWVTIWCAIVAGLAIAALAAVVIFTI